MRRGFTLIELMVAVAIIAVLIGIALPAFNNVRKQAQMTDTAALFNALSSGNEQFRGEQAIGGAYIPSQTDSIGNPAGNMVFGQIDDPVNPSNGPTAPGARQTPIAPVTGASLLVYGLAGADRLGTAGFRDLSDAADSSRGWYDDMGTWTTGTAFGLYHLAPPDLKPAHPRYGPYVDDKTLGRIVDFDDVFSERGMPDGDTTRTSMPTGAIREQPTFVDNWGLPILYYRAQRTATQMVTGGSPLVIGTYDLRDNMHLTGCNVAGINPTELGTDFGGGATPSGNRHAITVAKPILPDPIVDNMETTVFPDHFEVFIWDKDVSQRNVPVNRDSFLLISAGPDSFYGTADDVTNWTRK